MLGRRCPEPAIVRRATCCARAAGALVAAATVLLQPNGWGADGALAEAVVPQSTMSDQADPEPAQSIDTLCALVEAQAKHNKLPSIFFSRLLWKESLFDPEAVSPKGAQGIAQFMPSTAAERGLADPFDPDEAIPHSARFLRELRIRFGNLGLAAAAYNAGPQRVNDWLIGQSTLPAETLDYVLFITGRAAAGWKTAAAETNALGADDPEFDLTCNDFVAVASRGLIGGKSAARPVAVARHSGHEMMSAAAPASTAATNRPDEAASGEPVVSRLKGKGKVGYAVEAGIRSHAEARKTCSQLRASGSYCVVVIR